MRHAIIIGSAKSGTTSLYKWLIQHPDIIGCLRTKEPQFFSGPHGNSSDIDEYKALFVDSLFADRENIVMLEATTCYTKYPQYPSAAAFIQKSFPEVKLIYIMRNPFDRIVSHYNYSFANPPIFNYSQRKNIPLKQPRDIPELAAISDYFLQLSFYNFFYERGHLLLLDFDEIIDNPSNNIQKVFRFLDVKPFEAITIDASNVTSSENAITSVESLRRKLPYSVSSRIPIRLKHVFKTFEMSFFKSLPSNQLPCYLNSLSDADYDFYLKMLSPSMMRLSESYGVDVSKWGFK